LLDESASSGCNEVKNEHPLYSMREKKACVG
jgi:hypothetical protein